MSYAKIGFSLLLAISFSAGNAVCQELESDTIFAPVFAADFADVLIEAPSDEQAIEADKKPHGQSLMDVAMALTADSKSSKVKPRHNSQVIAFDAASNSNCCPPGCQSCRCEIASDLKGHCELMAKLLSVALREGEQSQDVQRKTIEATLMLIAETSEAKAQAKIAMLEASYQKQLAILQRQVVKPQPSVNSFGQVREWLRPLYKNQNRNYQQMKSIASNSVNLNRTVANLQRQMEAKLKPAHPQTIQNKLYEKSSAGEFATFEPARQQRLLPKLNPIEHDNIARVDNVAQANRIRKEIQDLQIQLQQLQQKNIRPASHLEPVFTPDQPLKPLYQR